jgi:diaminopimelate decarboxylase
MISIVGAVSSDSKVSCCIPLERDVNMQFGRPVTKKELYKIQNVVHRQKNSQRRTVCDLSGNSLIYKTVYMCVCHMVFYSKGKHKKEKEKVGKNNPCRMCT